MPIKTFVLIPESKMFDIEGIRERHLENMNLKKVDNASACKITQSMFTTSPFVSSFDIESDISQYLIVVS